ncbi:MAG TPA: hypothetical protein VE986_07650, partial [Hyphomicrobiales bacterium]|nr:hypothetical protein [Hyphomicrobiales bacterium]
MAPYARTYRSFDGNHLANKSMACRRPGLQQRKTRAQSAMTAGKISKPLPAKDFKKSQTLVA